MDKRILRVGDWIYDQSNYNYTMQATSECIGCANLFSPVVFLIEYLRGFKRDEVEGKEVWYKNEGSNLCAIQREGDAWRVSIHSESLKIEGIFKYVYQLQHFLTDCQIYWDVCDCVERR